MIYKRKGHKNCKVKQIYDNFKCEYNYKYTYIGYNSQ